MADFVAVLRKTIDGLADNSPAMRAKVYEKARSTVAAKLAAINPPPSPAVAERQKQVLEDAIRDVEALYAPPAEDDPFADLESIFNAPPGDHQAVEPAYPDEIPAPHQAAPAVDEDPVLPGSHAEPGSWSGRPEDMEVEAEVDERPTVSFEGDDEQPEDRAVVHEAPARRRNFMPLIAAVVALAVVAGGAYAIWLNKDDFMAMLGLDGQTIALAPAEEEPAPAATPPPGTATQSSTDAAPAGEAPAETPGVQKFTQRLNSDGTEVDEGPAGGIASIGEGTSVAAVTQPPAPESPAPDSTTPDVAQADGATTPPATGDVPPAAATGTAPVVPPTVPGAPATAATDGPTASDGQVAVGQKAIFYEERTNVAEGSADPGSIVWSLVQESPGNDLPPEAAIRGEATIPGKDVQLRMTIRRNADKTLPASHIIELIFLTPEGFEGGGIENILRFALKDTEEAAGSPVLGIPAKIADGFFLVALNDTKAEVETNMGLLRRERWIDVPLVYKSGRRALITMEKGVPGDKVFDEAIRAWQAATASAG